MTLHTIISFTNQQQQCYQHSDKRTASSQSSKAKEQEKGTELNITEENQHPQTTPLRKYRNLQRQKYQEYLRQREIEKSYQNAKIYRNVDGREHIKFPNVGEELEDDISFEEHMNLLKKKEDGLTLNYPWAFGTNIRFALRQLERHAEISYQPKQPYEKDNLRAYQVGEKMNTYFSEEEEQRPITMQDIEYAFTLYNNHCIKRGIMKSEDSIEYTRMLKVLTNLILTNRTLLNKSQQILQHAVSEFGRNDIAQINQYIEQHLRPFLQNEFNAQEKILLVKLPDYTIRSIWELEQCVDRYENMVVRAIQLMYWERCIIHSLEIGQKLMYICETTNASQLISKRQKPNEVPKDQFTKQDLLYQMQVIYQDSERDYKVINEPYQVQRPQP